MNKQEFLEMLRGKLQALPEEEITERLTFYSEMIDDRIEEGFSEEEAVSGIGSVDEIVSQITADIPQIETPAEEPNPKKIKNWKAILLALSAIVWVPLLIAVIATVVVLYVLLWLVVLSLWSVFGSLCAGAIGGIAFSVVLMFSKNPLSGIAMLGAAFVCTGLAIFMLMGCKALTKATVTLTKWITRKFSKKEEA